MYEYFFFRMKSNFQDVYHVYPVVIKAMFSIVIVVVLMFDFVSIYVINKTKRTHKNTRLLTTGLIVFDIGTLLGTLSRLFMSGETAAGYTRIVSFYFLFCGYSSVCLMCIDRCILFSSPIKYVAYLKHTSFKKISIVSWICLLLFLATLLLAHCGFELFNKPFNDPCFLTAGKIYGSFPILSNLIAAGCYIKIVRVVKIKRRQIFISLSPLGQSDSSKDIAQSQPNDVELITNNPASEMDQLEKYLTHNNTELTKDDNIKQESVLTPNQCPMSDTVKGPPDPTVERRNSSSTSLKTYLNKSHTKSLEPTHGTSTYGQPARDGSNKSIKKHTYAPLHSRAQTRNTYLVFAYLITMTLTNLIFFALFLTGTNNLVFLRLLNDSVYLLCGILNPFLYVIWFKECRMLFINLFTSCKPSWKIVVESMRFEVFDIVTKSYGQKTDTHPNTHV